MLCICNTSLFQSSSSSCTMHMVLIQRKRKPKSLVAMKASLRACSVSRLTPVQLGVGEGLNAAPQGCSVKRHLWLNQNRLSQRTQLTITYHNSIASDDALQPARSPNLCIALRRRPPEPGSIEPKFWDFGHMPRGRCRWAQSS